MVGEFDLIETYFKPLAGAEALGLGDDAACLTPSDGCDLVITKDMMISDVHFFKDDDPSNIAWKLLSANVSDLVAKGANPIGYLLGLGLPSDPDHEFLRYFSMGLSQAQKFYGLSLYGGDTVKSPGLLTLSVTALGEVPTGGMIKRSTAKVGDGVFVSGTIGDGALGLYCRQNKLNYAHLEEHFAKPKARLDLVSCMRDYASASADISDGLVADLSHILKASGNLGAEIDVSKVPLSQEAQHLLTEKTNLMSLVLTGGDDYELVFTARSEHEDTMLNSFCPYKNTIITKIGVVTDGNGVKVLRESGEEFPLEANGYQHF